MISTVPHTSKINMLQLNNLVQPPLNPIASEINLIWAQTNATLINMFGTNRASLDCIKTLDGTA